MIATQPGGDVRAFYTALGVQLPDWAHTEAAVRCFADPDAHHHQDRDPSCSVNLHSGAFYCHGCGAHGGAYDAALATGRSPREAIELMIGHALTERRPRPQRSGHVLPAGVRERSRAAASQTAPSIARTTPWTTPSSRRTAPQAKFAVTAEQVHEWARRLDRNVELLARLSADRGWAPRTLRQLRVGFDRERITVPIPAGHGAVQGLLRLRVHAWQRPKVLALPGTRLGLTPRPTHDEQDVWLVEGPSDMLAARSAGLPAIAVPGTNAWRTDWASDLGARRVTVVMDADRPGRHAALRIARDLEQHGAARVRILELAPGRDDGYDLTDWLREHGHKRAPAAARTYKCEEFRQLLDSTRRFHPASASSSAARALAASSSAAVRDAGGRSHKCARF